MTDDNNEQETIMEFPCEFAIKTMGLSNKEFDLTVVEIVRRHSSDIPEGAVKTKPSKTGKYVSVTITITAQSKKQMDAIYQDLTDCEHVLMSL
jgi:putative lipoic acid-binding regulatory protein